MLTFPEYVISKNKIELTPDTNVDAILANVAQIYKNEQVNTIDGVKIDFADGWVHLRKSNTEPIIRIYAESSSLEAANGLAQQIINVINLVNGDCITTGEYEPEDIEKFIKNGDWIVLHN